MSAEPKFPLGQIVATPNALHCLSSSAGTKFWIITEADRSATTVLMPEDY